MNNSKTIHDYLDGELSSTRQDALFAELAKDSALRDEFNQQMKLHMISQSDMALISPPAATTNAIFANLGFTIPPSAGNSLASDSTVSGGGLAATVIMFLKRHAANVMTAVLSAVLTGLIIYFLIDYNFGNNSNFAANQDMKNYPAVASSGSSPVTVIPSIDQSGISEADVSRIVNDAMSKYMTEINNHYQNYYAALQEQRLNDVSEPNSTSNQPNVIYVPYEKYFTNTPVESDYNREPVINSNLGNDNVLTSTASINPVASYETDYTVYLRGYSAKSNVNVNVPSQSNPWFINMGLGAAYNINNEHRVGVEIGQEAYPQVFQRSSWGEELTFYQNPVLFWYGATYRYSMTDIIIPDVLYPYAQVMGGFTEVGPVGRAQLGLSYRPDERVSFNLGLEGSGLWYNVDNTIYNTKKFGFTYGVSINY